MSTLSSRFSHLKTSKEKENGHKPFRGWKSLILARWLRSNLWSLPYFKVWQYLVVPVYSSPLTSESANGRINLNSLVWGYFNTVWRGNSLHFVMVVTIWRFIDMSFIFQLVFTLFRISTLKLCVPMKVILVVTITACSREQTYHSGLKPRILWMTLIYK